MLLVVTCVRPANGAAINYDIVYDVENAFNKLSTILIHSQALNVSVGKLSEKMNRISMSWRHRVSGYDYHESDGMN